MSRRGALLALRAELQQLRHLRDLAEVLLNHLRVVEFAEPMDPQLRRAYAEAGIEPATRAFRVWNGEEIEEQVNNLMASIRLAHRHELSTEEKLRLSQLEG